MVWAEAAQVGFPSDFIMLLLTTFGGFYLLQIQDQIKNKNHSFLCLHNTRNNKTRIHLLIVYV
ncbi:hypothetical protein T09_3267 [Trichinella sp. T9]|nr:hypothetical protein T09_3267 [Trichinella sp. T9]